MINSVQTVYCSVQCTRQRTVSVAISWVRWSGRNTPRCASGMGSYRALWRKLDSQNDRARPRRTTRQGAQCGSRSGRARWTTDARAATPAQPVSDCGHRRGQDAQTDDGTHHTRPPRLQRAVFARSSDQPKLAQISTRLVEVARKVLRHVAHKAFTRHRGVRDRVGHICAVEAAHVLEVF